MFLFASIFLNHLFLRQEQIWKKSNLNATPIFQKEGCTCNLNLGFYQGFNVATETAKNDQYLNPLRLNHTKEDFSTISLNLNIHAHRDKLSNS